MLFETSTIKSYTSLTSSRYSLCRGLGNYHLIPEEHLQEVFALQRKTAHAVLVTVRCRERRPLPTSAHRSRRTLLAVRCHRVARLHRHRQRRRDVSHRAPRARDELALRAMAPRLAARSIGGFLLVAVELRGARGSPRG